MNTSPTPFLDAVAHDRPTSPYLSQPPAVRWLPVIGFAAMMLALARHAALGISDPDTLWHILAGKSLRQTWDFAGQDTLARFTVEPFVMHQWLPDLVLSVVADMGGLPAVAWLGQVGRIAVCMAVFLLCRRHAGPLAGSLVTCLAVLGMADSLSPRPQLVGFVLLAVTVGAWLQTAADGRPRWWLVPLMWVWASSHGTWVIGLLVGTVVIAGMLMDRRTTLRQALPLAAVSGLATVAASATPLGPRIFETFATIRAVSPYIQEWRTPTLSPSVLATLALACVTGLTWLIRRQRVPWTHLLLFALGVAWAAAYMRTVAVGAIILSPLAASALDSALGRPRVALRRPEVAVVVGGALASIALAATLAASGPRAPVGIPRALDPQLSALPTGAVVYNADILGGWLMWSHQTLLHTRDTRAELYGAEQAREYLAIMAAEPGWQDRLARYGASAALIPEHSALVGALSGSGWTLAGKDAGYLLLEAPR